MSKIVSLVLLICLCAGHLTGQQRVIVDLDIDSDVDDVSALAMLNTMHNRGKVRLLGVIVTSDDSSAATCASAVNTYFGNKKVPIGILKSQPYLRNFSRYTRKVSEEFPSQTAKPEHLPDATSLYRRLLAENPDTSVIIITIAVW